ncbi:hypothetical protein ACLBXM_04970 [Xanthobacteraceae bacterium A53D]
MSTFRRTRSALFSLHRFYQVDVIVLCEGGMPISLDDAIAGKGTDGTADALFWERMIMPIPNGKQYHFKSIGSRSALISMADDLHTQNIDTITVCVDRDFNFISTPHPCNRVAYTFGYSWECDVLADGCAYDFIRSILGDGENVTAMIDDLKVNIDQIKLDLVRWCEIDAALVCKSKSGIFDRSKPMAALKIHDGRAVLDKEYLSRRLKAAGYKRSPRRTLRFTVENVMHNCFGHLIKKMFFQLVMNKLKNVGIGMPTVDFFMRNCVYLLSLKLKSGTLPKLSAHFESQRLAFY